LGHRASPRPRSLPALTWLFPVTQGLGMLIVMARRSWRMHLLDSAHA
jgi:hypothetical protein